MEGREEIKEIEETTLRQWREIKKWANKDKKIEM